jgi:hypothetical protein
MDFIKNKPGVDIPYTFIIDSNEKLAAWAGNVAGNDYSIVLVKSGTWSSSVEVNLTTTGTKIVVGQPGSLLAFSSEYGLKYDALPSEDYMMKDVNVKVYRSVTSPSVFYFYTYAFHKCINLSNCKVDIYAYLKNTSGGTAVSRVYGFNECKNLQKCYVKASADGITSSGTALHYEVCYYFNNCINLFFCGISDRPVRSSTIFSNCSNLTGCSIETDDYYDLTGFSNCTCLVNCTAIVQSSTKWAYGFQNCKQLIKCAATGIASTSSQSGYGFYSCRILFFCETKASSSTATYGDCYMHASGTDDPVDDSAAGGYNTPETGANPDGENNVQSDWNQDDEEADDYIKNKPSIPPDFSDEISALQSITVIRGNVDTYTDLLDIDTSGMRTNDSYIVEHDENHDGNSAIYTYSGSTWNFTHLWEINLRLKYGSYTISSGSFSFEKFATKNGNSEEFDVLEVSFEGSSTSYFVSITSSLSNAGDTGIMIFNVPVNKMATLSFGFPHKLVDGGELTLKPGIHVVSLLRSSVSIVNIAPYE